MHAYYNENDPKAASWLRELMKQGHIAAGEVDERSITDVHAADLAAFTQCHFFAGIGVWSYALKQALWPTDRQVWTGSCPCQPFSAAGAQKGFSDTRHLWPSWYRLIRECRPRVIFGEQVASSSLWLDLVSGDLENQGYAFGSAVLGAHSVGAPHIRQRLYFVAGSTPSGGPNHEEHTDAHRRNGSGRSRPTGELADSSSLRLDEQRPTSPTPLQGERPIREGQQTRPEHDGQLSRRSEGLRGLGVDGFWRDADWLYCRDQKYRPVEPLTFPLAHGAPARVGRLRGYGNALVAPLAQAFIASYLDICG